MSKKDRTRRIMHKQIELNCEYKRFNGTITKKKNNKDLSPGRQLKSIKNIKFKKS